MSSNDKQLIAVIGATGQQGGSVVRALQTSGQFKVRALTRDPGKHRELAEEVVEADLDRPETLKAAFKGAHGVFLVTNFWEIGKKNDELKQATAAVHAAKDAGVKHLVWSTLPNVEAISGGKFHLPHFTGKAKLDKIVQEAGFENHTFVIAPCYYQNFVGTMAPQKQANGSVGWALPIDPNVRCIHMGDIGELGNIVAGAFAHPDQAGNGEYLPLVGDFMSFNQIIDTLNKQGHRYSFSQVPAEAFAASFPGAAEVAEMFGYFEAHTYLGSDSNEEIALANKIAGKQPTNFAAWAQANFPVLTANGTRKVVAIDQFGGIEKMKVQTLSIPEILSDEILVRVESAGVGVWDPFEREGFFAQITNQKPSFPYILGSDGAGTIVAVGENVTKFKEGDRIYGFSSFDGRTGFYSEYAVVKADTASLLPPGLSLQTAGAMPVDAMTALRGLDDSLHLKSGETVMIFGASGGIGHLALQLAKRMGARVFAVASGADGVAFAKRLGADVVVDGRKDDVVAAARAFAPNGLDTALLTAGGEAAETALTAVKKGGRVAYPHGVELKGTVRSDIKVTDYDGWPDQQAIDKLNRLIQSGQFEVHVAHAYPLEEATEAHKALKTHYLGKLSLRVH